LYCTFLQVKAREQELKQRVQELEEQLQQETMQRASVQARADVAARKLKEVAERSRARGNMLVQLVSSVQAVVAAKQQLADVEKELGQVLEAAAALVQVRGRGVNGKFHDMP
jgi:cell division septum initiation protein DivIVA